MQKFWGLAVAGILALGFSNGDAEAKRRGFPIYIPGGGSSETIELVKELPDIEALKRPDGKYIDLGYLHQGSTGQWIGHIGSDTQYMKLTKAELNALIKIGGLSKLPPLPERASSYSGGSLSWILVLIGIFIMIKRAFRFVKNLGSTAVSSAQTLSRTFQSSDQSAVDNAAIEARIAQAAASYQSAPSNYAPSNYASNAPRASFGQRR